MDQERLEAAGYIASQEIVTTLKLALALDKPILVEGPAGTGKTSIALTVAKALERKLLRIQCWEGISSEQVIGEFDYRKQLLMIQMAEKSDVKMENVFSPEYFIQRPLLKAFASSESCVLLVDEVDKSDDEFEAFLLEALGEKQVTVPELGTFQSSSSVLVVLTSNQSRDLSEPLRRRCLYLYLDFPSVEREREILSIHCNLPLDTPLLDAVTSAVSKIRQKDLKKAPSIAESIDWTRAILALGEEYLSEETMKKTLGVLLKHKEDLEMIEGWIGELLRKPQHSTQP